MRGGLKLLVLLVLLGMVGTARQSSASPGQAARESDSSRKETGEGGRFTVPRAIALLQRGERAERRAIYSGLKVIRASCSARSGGEYLRKARIWHGGWRQTRLEFLRTDGGPAPVVIENGSMRWLYSPKRRL